MRKLAFLFLLAPFITVWVYGCDTAENPIGLNEQFLTTDQAAAAGPMNMARESPKMVPLKGRLSFQDDLSIPPVPCFIPLPEFPDPVAFMPARIFAQGQWTHLGKTTSVILLDVCIATPGGLVASGTATHTGADGDAIEVEWDGLFKPDDTISFDPIVITGGTGRFVGASGWAIGGGSLDAATFWVDGMISSVGSIGD